MPPVRICAGGVGKPASLPRPAVVALAGNTAQRCCIMLRPGDLDAFATGCLASATGCRTHRIRSQAFWESHVSQAPSRLILDG
jgi:hypothetical protein